MLIIVCVIVVPVSGMPEFRDVIIVILMKYLVAQVMAVRGIPIVVAVTVQARLTVYGIQALLPVNAIVTK